jgi:hypothetical protein
MDELIPIDASGNDDEDDAEHADTDKAARALA